LSVVLSPGELGERVSNLEGNKGVLVGINR
jgi:hypothetical protein